MRQNWGKYNQCGRKKRYTHRQANKVVQRLNEKQGKVVHQYFCDHCGQRHVGGMNFENVERADQKNY